MVVCSDVLEFGRYYFDKSGKYRFEDLSFATPMKWDELYQYCMRECSNNPDLYAVISDMYLNGKSVSMNKEKSVVYLMNGIDKGSAHCLYVLGLRYHNGDGVLRSYAKAMDNFKKASKCKHPQALFMMGYYYSEGVGVSEAPKKANKYYQQAAALGDLQALEKIEE